MFVVLPPPPKLDSWSVILNGSVEVTYPEGRPEILCMGNSFGVSPTIEKEYMKGVMKTKVDDCQVRLSTETGYYDGLSVDWPVIWAFSPIY